MERIQEYSACLKRILWHLNPYYYVFKDDFSEYWIVRMVLIQQLSVVLENLVSLAGIRVLSLCVGYGHLSFSGFFPLSLWTLKAVFATYGPQITLSQYLPCASFPSQFLRPQNVLDTSILTAVAFPLAWFKCFILQKLSLGGETKPRGGLTSRVCIWCGTPGILCNHVLSGTPN